MCGGGAGAGGSEEELTAQDSPPLLEKPDLAPRRPRAPHRRQHWNLTKLDELLWWKLAKEAAEKELEEFVHLLKSAKALPLDSKPPKDSWLMEEKVKQKIESLQAYAVDACDDEQRRMAGNILKATGFSQTSAPALKLLINVGYFPVHVNLDLFRYDVQTTYSEEVLSVAEELLVDCPDSDKHIRKDLSTLKVYAIDVDEADELDDALSATGLPDGRIKVWIHVADPTCFLQPRSIIDREAMHRGTLIFLPTATYPMFPEKACHECYEFATGYRLQICKRICGFESRWKLLDIHPQEQVCVLSSQIDGMAFVSPAVLDSFIASGITFSI